MLNTENRELYPYHRRFIRKKVRVKVEIQQGKSYNTWTLNISQDGLCFEIPEQIQDGKNVIIWVFPTSGKSKLKPVLAKCKVVWSEQGKKHIRHGGQFVEFEDDGQKQLTGWLRKS